MEEEKTGITVQWPKWEKLMNKKFIPIIKNDDHFLILYGGRGSGKSKAVAMKLIYKCLTETHFRCVIVRKVFNSIQNSAWKNLQDLVQELGLQELFEFTAQPLSVKCFNGNNFIALGCDDVQKVKSISEVSHLWIEEDIINEDDFVVITSSIRTTKVKTQIILSINPEVEENSYEDNWLYKRFFAHREGELSFRDIIKVNLGEKQIDLSYTVLHSTYNDNRFLSEIYKASLEDLKRTDSYRYQVYALGEWGNRTSGGLFYPSFNRGLHVEKVEYNPDKALHVALDFNNNPGNACSVWQVDGMTATCISSFFAKSEYGNTKELCNKLKADYHMHAAGFYIYGDASSKHEDTRSEAGWNDYKLIEKELKERFHPTFLIPSKNPPVELRGQFIGEVFSHNLNGLKIIIGATCRELISDLQNCKVDADRTKLKAMIKKDGLSYQQWGHQLDCFEYLFIKVYEKEFTAYKRGRKYNPEQKDTSFFIPRTTMGY